MISSDHPHLAPELHDIAYRPSRTGLCLLPSLPLEPASDPNSYDIDVVAMHGLGGDMYRTWKFAGKKNAENEMFWLSHLLPRDLPGARVFSFGYASGWAFSKSVAGIRDYARQLLQALLRFSDKVS